MPPTSSATTLTTSNPDVDEMRVGPPGFGLGGVGEHRVGTPGQAGTHAITWTSRAPMATSVAAVTPRLGLPITRATTINTASASSQALRARNTSRPIPRPAGW